jgi:hypothetical protein
MEPMNVLSIKNLLNRRILIVFIGILPIFCLGQNRIVQADESNEIITNLLLGQKLLLINDSTFGIAIQRDLFAIYSNSGKLIKKRQVDSSLISEIYHKRFKRDSMLLTFNETYSLLSEEGKPLCWILATEKCEGGILLSVVYYSIRREKFENNNALRFKLNPIFIKLNDQLNAVSYIDSPTFLDNVSYERGFKVINNTLIFTSRTDSNSVDLAYIKYKIDGSALVNPESANFKTKGFGYFDCWDLEELQQNRLILATRKNLYLVNQFKNVIISNQEIPEMEVNILPKIVRLNAIGNFVDLVFWDNFSTLRHLKFKVTKDSLEQISSVYNKISFNGKLLDFVVTKKKIIMLVYDDEKYFFVFSDII